MKFNMKSHNFSHAYSSTLYKRSNNIFWDFGSDVNSTSFYIDGDVTRGIIDRNDGKRKFLWGLESRHFNNGLFDFIESNLDLVLDTYEAIFTFNDKFLELDPKFKWVPAMGTWIDEIKVNRKTKLVSMVTSNKQITENQKFRVRFSQVNSDSLDLYGSIKNHIQSKEVALNDYMFSVAIENDTYNTYFTEKILDCFSTGTIPIYKGTSRIEKFFNKDGIIFLEEAKLPELSVELYNTKIEAVMENLDIAKRFNTIEDWMFENYYDILN
jgi:hypothetical protein